METGERRRETVGRQDEVRKINVGWIDGLEKCHIWNDDNLSLHFYTA